MAFVEYNPHPYSYRIDDCYIRATCKALGMDWDTAFIALAMNAYSLKYTMDSKANMFALLNDYGYTRYAIPNTCPICYTVAQFAEDHPRGAFIIGTSTHVLVMEDGNWFDTWDSRDEVPLFVWVKEDKKDVE